MEPSPPAADGRRRPWPRRARRVLVVLVAATLLTGCGVFGSDADGATPSTSTSTSSTTSTTSPPVAVSDPPTVLDPGAEPRQKLRIQLTEGQEATVRFTSDLAVDQDTGARPQGLDSPPITQVLGYRVGEVTGTGAEVTVEITDIGIAAKGTGLSDEAISRLQADLDPIVGTTGTGRITPLGEFEDLTFELPDDTSDAVEAQVTALGDQIGALGPSLPAQAVGVGARWEATSTSGPSDAPTETTTTYTVTAMTEGELGYTATITSSASAHDLVTPDLPKGTTARLASSELTGTTTGSVRLDQIGFELRTALSGPQTIVLTKDGTDTTVTQQLRLDQRATTNAD